MTCKNRPRYDLYCVWWDVKPCSINQSAGEAVSVGFLSQECLGCELQRLVPVFSYRKYKPAGKRVDETNNTASGETEKLPLQNGRSQQQKKMPGVS